MGCILSKTSLKTLEIFITYARATYLLPQLLKMNKQLLKSIECIRIVLCKVKIHVLQSELSRFRAPIF